jgi:predicted nucleic acid-binding protein
MPKAIADTGPLLHLHEIGRIESLACFDELTLPDLVAQELRAYQLDPACLGVAGLRVTLRTVDKSAWEPILYLADQPAIQPADAQVFILARESGYRTVVLSDDLALRRRLEKEGAGVVGSVGVLVRAYTSGRLERGALDDALDALFTTSTLHMSFAFRAYVRHLLDDLP